MLFNNTNLRTAMAYTNAAGDKVYPIIVDIKKGIKSTEEVSFVSSDINTGILSVAFIQGNDTYIVEGAEVICSIMRPDTTTLEIPCNIVNDNIVEVPLGVNGTSQDGVYSFDFKIFKGGDKIVGTPIMSYSVSLSISNDSVVAEDDRLPVLTMLITQVTELKDEVREVINQANTATEATKAATANAIEATNSVNAAINAANQKMLEVDNAKNEMTTTVSNKVNEVENRFNALTTSQQQDAEVINARDGETSLKARLDRDTEKANKELDKIKKLEESTISTVTTESDFITVEATSGGYFEDVKLEGKTLVNLWNGKTRYDEVCTTHIKPNTLYTMIVDLIGTVSDGQINIGTDLVGGDTMIISNGSTTGRYMRTVTSSESSTGLRIYPTKPCDISINTTILEGDHTQNPPNGHIEGLKSVGEGTDEIVVSSVNNFLNINDLYNTKEIKDNYKWYIFKGQPNTKYIISSYLDKEARSTMYLKVTDANYTQTFGWLCHNDVSRLVDYVMITTDSEGRVGIAYRNISAENVLNILNSFSIYKGDTVKELKKDKKRLLYYNNETQAWEKPILRQWDSIEKHADGKYYYHQRSGEVVLNGSENWLTSSGNSNDITSLFYFKIDDRKYNSEGICNKFTCINGFSIEYPEGIYYGTDINIRISTSKLSTQDVEGFKQWLQANNITVVYQLAQEEVYECTNIDLITYANETNYIVESGAIAPKSILKVHSNITNVVKILQEKVSLLENKFIEGLKKVLAGDVYSLAELLYPEDFVEENLENDIMLLPFE